MVWHQPGLTPRRRAAARDDLSLLRLSPGPLDDEPAASKLSSPRPARSLAVPSLAVPTTRAARSLAASLQLPTMMAGGEGPGPRDREARARRAGERHWHDGSRMVGDTLSPRRRMVGAPPRLSAERKPPRASAGPGAPVPRHQQQLQVSARRLVVTDRELVQPHRDTSQMRAGPWGWTKEEAGLWTCAVCGVAHDTWRAGLRHVYSHASAYGAWFSPATEHQQRRIFASRAELEAYLTSGSREQQVPRIGGVNNSTTRELRRTEPLDSPRRDSERELTNWPWAAERSQQAAASRYRLTPRRAATESHDFLLQKQAEVCSAAGAIAGSVPGRAGSFDAVVSSNYCGRLA